MNHMTVSSSTDPHPDHPALAALQTADRAGFREHWLGPQATLWRQARQNHGRLDEPLLQSLDALVQNGNPTAEQASHSHAASSTVSPIAALSDLIKAVHLGVSDSSAAGDETLLDRTAWQARGMLAVLRAAHELQGWRSGSLPVEFERWSNLALEAYASAVPLESPMIESGVAMSAQAFSTEGPTSARATAALRRKACRAHVLLMFRRALSYVLGEPEQAHGSPQVSVPPVVLSTLFATPSPSSRIEPQGFVRELLIESATDICYGPYLDPIALGLVAIHVSIVRSLSLAWRMADPEIKRLALERGSFERLPALRIAPDLTPRGPEYVVCLSGGSAGGLFFCGLYAAAVGLPLNPLSTASISLGTELPQPATSEMAARLEGIPLQPVQRESLPAKIRAAGKAGLQRIVLQRAQYAEVLEHNVAIPPELELVPADDLRDLLHKLQEIDPIDECDQALVEREMDWLERCHAQLKLPFSHMRAASLDQVYTALKVDSRSDHERQATYRVLLEQAAEGTVELLASSGTALDQATQAYVRQGGWGIPEEYGIGLLLAPREANRSLTLGQVYHDHSCLVILGDPGSGKTTLARWLALTMARAWKNRRQCVEVPLTALDPKCADSDQVFDLGPWRLPLLVVATEFADAMERCRDQSLTLMQYLGAQRWRDGSRPSFGAGEQFGQPIPDEARQALVRRAIERKVALVIIDGLDEVTSSETRERVRNAVSDFLREHVAPPRRSVDGRTLSTLLSDAHSTFARNSGNRLVVTSRIAGYNLCPLEGNLHTVVVEGMSTDAVKRFVSNWMRAMSDTVESASEKSDRLLHELEDPRRRLARFITNPLQVGVLTAVFHDQGKLAETRVENYRLAVSKFFEIWHQRVDAEHGRDATELEAFDDAPLLRMLEDVAQWIHQNSPTGMIREQELKDLLASPPRPTSETLAGRSSEGSNVASPYLSRRHIDELMRVLSNDIGVLAPRGPAMFGFTVHSIQEYLVGRRLARGDVAAIADTIHSHLDDTRYREPILMALGVISVERQGDLSKVITRLLELDDHFGDLLPRSALMVIAAFDDLVSYSRDSVAKIVERLVTAYAQQQATPWLKKLVEDAIARLRTACEQLVEETIQDLLRARISRQAVAFKSTEHIGSAAAWVETPDAMACSIASILLELEWFTASLVDALWDARSLDDLDRDSPIHRALQVAASGHPGHQTSYKGSPTYGEPKRAPLAASAPHPVRDALALRSRTGASLPNDPRWMAVLIGMYGGIGDWRAHDDADSYYRFAFYLWFGDDMRQRYSTGLHRRWGKKDPVYAIAVHLDTRGGRWKTGVGMQPEIQPVWIVGRTAFDEGIAEALRDGWDFERVAAELRVHLRTEADPAKRADAIALLMLGDDPGSDAWTREFSAADRAAAHRRLRRARALMRDAWFRATACLEPRVIRRLNAAAPRYRRFFFGAYKQTAAELATDPANGDCATAIEELDFAEMLVVMHTRHFNANREAPTAADLLEIADSNVSGPLDVFLRRVGESCLFESPSSTLAWNVEKLQPTRDSQRSSRMTPPQRFAVESRQFLRTLMRKWSLSAPRRPRGMSPQTDPVPDTETTAAEFDVGIHAYNSLLAIPNDYAKSRSLLLAAVSQRIRGRHALELEFRAALLVEAINPYSAEIRRRFNVSLESTGSGESTREELRRLAKLEPDDFAAARVFIRLADAWGDERTSLLDEAFGRAIKVVDPHEQAQAFEQIAIRCATDQRRERVSRLLQVIPWIKDADQRARAFGRAVFLAAEKQRAGLLRRALNASQDVSDEEARAELLRQLRPLARVYSELDADLQFAIDSLHDPVARAWAERRHAEILNELRAEFGEGQELARMSLSVLATWAKLGELEVDQNDWQSRTWENLARHADPTIVQTLCERGESWGVRLTGAAALALDLLVERGETALLEPLWRLLRQPDVQALPIVENWARVDSKPLFTPSTNKAREPLAPSITRSTSAALLIGEARGPQAEILAELARCLNATDSFIRKRAEWIAVQDWSLGVASQTPPRLSLTRMGRAFAYSLIKEVSRANFSTAGWLLNLNEFIAYDDKLPLRDWLRGAEQSVENGWPLSIASDIEYTTDEVAMELCRGLLNAGPRTQQHILQSFALLAVRDRYQRDWPVHSALNPAYFDSLRYYPTIQSNDEQVAAIVRALTTARAKYPDLDAAHLYPQALIQLESESRSFGEVIRSGDHDAFVDALKRLGNRILYAGRAEKYLQTAAYEVEPLEHDGVVVQALLAWCGDQRERLKRAGVEGTTFSILGRESWLYCALIQTLAGLAQRAPAVFYSALSPREIRERFRNQLCEDARFGASRIVRACALSMLGNLREVTERVARVFLESFRERTDVIEAALDATEQFHTVARGALQPLIGSPENRDGLYSDDTVAAYAAGRILQSVGQNIWTNHEDRRVIMQALADAVRHPRSQRTTHLGPPLPNLPPAPTLAQEFYAALVAVARLSET
jgi:hypothetical protein